MPVCLTTYPGPWVVSSIPAPCADPGIFVSGGGGGGGGGGGEGGIQVSLTKKSSYVFFVFFSPQPILQKSNCQFQRNLSFFKGPEEGPTFSREGGGGQIAYFLKKPI